MPFLTFICPCISSISLKYNQQDATFSRSIYFYKFLYMFQVVPPPIIRSTKLYTQRQVLSNKYCCLLLSWMWCNYVPSHPTCRAIYRNKEIEKTLHLLGCILGKQKMSYHALKFTYILGSLQWPSSGCFTRILVKYNIWIVTLRRLMSYIYGAPILDVSRSHTTTQHSR